MLLELWLFHECFVDDDQFEWHCFEKKDSNNQRQFYLFGIYNLYSRSTKLSDFVEGMEEEEKQPISLQSSPTNSENYASI